jgi:hypothetical protein
MILGAARKAVRFHATLKGAPPRTAVPSGKVSNRTSPKIQMPVASVIVSFLVFLRNDRYQYISLNKSIKEKVYGKRKKNNCELGN